MRLLIDVSPRHPFTYAQLVMPILRDDAIRPFLLLFHRGLTRAHHFFVFLWISPRFMKNALDLVTRKWLHASMRYRVVIKKKALKGIAKMPQEIQRRMKMLVNDLVLNGPVLPTWPNFSKLSPG